MSTTGASGQEHFSRSSSSFRNCRRKDPGHLKAGQSQFSPCENNTAKCCDQRCKVQLAARNYSTLQGLTLKFILFNVLIINPNGRTICILSKSADNTRLGGTTKLVPEQKTQSRWSQAEQNS